MMSLNYTSILKVYKLVVYVVTAVDSMAITTCTTN